MSNTLGDVLNISGTSYSSFKIGLGTTAPNISQGTSSPISLSLTGNSGDLYIQTGGSPSLWQLISSTWSQIGTGAGSPGGSNLQVQYNLNGSFSGASATTIINSGTAMRFNVSSNNSGPPLIFGGITTNSITQTAPFIIAYDGNNNALFAMDSTASFNLHGSLYIDGSTSLPTIGYRTTAGKLVVGGFDPSASAITGAYFQAIGNTNGGTGTTFSGGFEMVMDASQGATNINFLSYTGSSYNNILQLESGGSVSTAHNTLDNGYGFILSNGYPVVRFVAAAPTSSTASGSKGDYFANSSFAYFCIATNTWVRIAVTSSF